MKKFHFLLIALSCGAMMWAQEPLTIEIDEPLTVNAGESATLTGIWAGGTEPYTVVWADQQGNKIATTEGEEYQITVTPTVSTGYTLTVTDATGTTVTRRTGVKVRGVHVVADFEDNTIPDVGYDQGYSDWEQIYSGSYGLEVGSYYTESEWGNYWTWYGYALSNLTSDTYSGNLYPDQFHSAPGGAHSGNNFIIASPVPFGDDPCAIEVTAEEDGEEISGFYITNTAYAYDAIKNGNYYSAAFDDGSYFVLQIFAEHPDGSTTEKDFYLADFRAANKADHYVIDKWEWLDLSDMGKITKLTFNFDSSDKVSYDGGVTYYLNTPMYFAMDDLGGDPVIEQSTLLWGVTEGKTDKYDLSKIFEIENDGSTVTYTIDEPIDNEGISLDIDAENGKLLINGIEDAASGTVLLSATQKGHTQYVELTVRIDRVSAVTDLDATEVVGVHYINAAGVVSSNPFAGFNIEVRTYSDGTTSAVKVLR